MIFVGSLITYVYFTEITPLNYDAYYQRYVGSSFPRIFGILVAMAGLILFWGASIFLVYSNWRRPNSIGDEGDPVEQDSAERQGEYYLENNLSLEPQIVREKVYVIDQPRLERTVVKQKYME